MLIEVLVEADFVADHRLVERNPRLVNVGAHLSDEVFMDDAGGRGCLALGQWHVFSVAQFAVGFVLDELSGLGTGPIAIVTQPLGGGLQFREQVFKFGAAQLVLLLDNFGSPWVAPAHGVQNLFSLGRGKLQLQSSASLIHHGFKQVEIEVFVCPHLGGNLLRGHHDVALGLPCGLRQQLFAVLGRECYFFALKMVLNGFGMGLEVGIDIVTVLAVDPFHDLLHARCESQGGNAFRAELRRQTQGAFYGYLVITKVPVVEDL